jgi:hypothetical protein
VVKPGSEPRGNGQNGDGAVKPPTTRGLPSVAEARRARKRLTRMPGRFWLWSGVVLVAGFVIWWKREEGEIQRMRSELLARQRATVAELGPRWFPLRDKIEAWTIKCATGTEEVIDEPTLRSWDFRSLPGIYLRLGLQDAASPQSIRKAARRSLRDGFTACLLLVENPNPLAGPACESNKDCPPRQHCNEFERCSEYAQPYSLRLAYKTMWLLTDEWVDEINATTKELTMRGAVASFDDWNTYDIPVAADLLTRAKYFLAVVDEPAPADDAEPADGGAPAHEPRGEEQPADEDDPTGPAVSPSIPTAPHPARVCAWRLEDDRQVLAIRRHAAGRFVGGATSVDAPTMAARQRQANSCALALEVRAALGDDTATKLPD